MTPTPEQLREFDAAGATTTETATFALGCFWGPDARFGAMDGVVRTRVGYAGGTTPDPTYHDLGDQTEVFQVDYDPERLSYAKLCSVVFEAHSPHHQTGKRQYHNIVFVDSPRQREQLTDVLASRGLDPDSIETRIERLSRFYPAESYHQKHSLRARDSLVQAFRRAGYDDEQLRESPAAAKCNGYAAGHGIDAENLGLSSNRTVR